MKQSYLALDFGASSGRAIVGTLEKGRLTLSEVHRFDNGPVENGGMFFWDVERLFAEAREGVRKALKAVPSLAGIAVDTWGVDYVLVKDGKVAAPVYSYRDPRTNGMAEVVARLVPDRKLYAKTGIQSMFFNTSYQLMAHSRARPQELKGTTLLLMPDAITWMLCGSLGAELTEASTTQLLDAKKKCWDATTLKALGFPRELFPPIADPGSLAGTLRPELAKKFKCGQIPVFRVGSHDTASAAAAVPAKAGASYAFLSLGTWALFGVESATPVLSEKARKAGFSNECGLDGKTLFLSNIVGTWLLQETRRTWTEQGRKVSFDDIEKMAAGTKRYGFFIDPNHASFQSPCDMPAKIREFLAQTGQGTASDAEVVRCIYDSLALRFKVQLAHMEALTGQKLAILHVIGGGCKDKFLLQAIADATGIPVVAGPVEATAAGNILVQALGAGIIKSLDQARTIVRRSFPCETYKPGKGGPSASDLARFKKAMH